jgi:hypothetical protein
MYIFVITGRHFSSSNAFANAALLLPVMCNKNPGSGNGALRLENALMRRRLELIPDQLTHFFGTEI